MNFDYVFIRDVGITQLLPFLSYLSDETLMTVLARKWQSVSDEQRGIVKAELGRRYPQVTFDS